MTEQDTTCTRPECCNEHWTCPDLAWCPVLDRRCSLLVDQHRCRQVCRRCEAVKGGGR
jgi:hypothetical protein